MRFAKTSSRVRSSGAKRSISSSKVRLASSISAHSSPRASTVTRCGSLGSSSSPSAFASRRAGSIVTTATFSPRSASPSATAAAVVVLPTPPGPAQMTIRFPSSKGSRDVSMRTSDQALAYRERDRLRAAAGVELGHHVVQHVLDGALGIAELLRDLARGMAGGDERQDLLLAVGQLGRDGPGARAVLGLLVVREQVLEQIGGDHAGPARRRLDGRC